MLPSDRTGLVEKEMDTDETIDLLGLPIEIRTLIYRYLLIASSEPLSTVNSDLVVSGSIKCGLFTFNGQRMLEVPSSRACNPVDVAILQTCKRIRAEALPLLYSKNTFHRRCPYLTSNLLRVVPNIQSLDLWMNTSFELKDWLELLAYIDDFKTLRCLSITFGEDDFDGYPSRLGKSLELARRISQIKSLKKLTLEGFYGRSWPTFFRTHMDCEVVSYPAFRRLHPRFLSSLPCRAVILEDFEKLQAREFLQYQEATRNLDPADDKLAEEEKRAHDWCYFCWEHVEFSDEESD